ncbi:SAVED domain-containing protein [Williamsia sp.]|uniref:SAVED domain-containing protein n=1 Tax=Williamsia sp. TaxID=1872085 RepID=UPI002F94054B
MAGNKMPSATGVRIAGDNYQWLHVWRVCMEALHHDLTSKTDNPTIAVGVEEPGVGNGDDVVQHRLRPPHAYTQVKYAVDNRTAVGLNYLADEGILRKMVAAHKTLAADGTPVEMRLSTNRTNDPNDLLMQQREGCDGRLVPRGARGGPTSALGKARAAWAEAANTDEANLMAFLEDFHLTIAYDLTRLRDEVSHLMTANGLRSDDNAVSQGADWVAAQVRAGHRRLDLDDIKQAITSMGLQSGSPWTTVSIATIKHDELAAQAAVSIDWVERIAGEKPWHRVAPATPHTWADLAADISTVPSQLGGVRRILVSGSMRQATGFLLGAELRRVLGYEIGIRQGDQLWSSEDATNTFRLQVDEHATGSGSETALIVNIAANATDAVTDWIRRTGLPVAQIVTAAPAAGVGPRAVTSPAAANSLAVEIRNLARQNARSEALHLFLIGPLGLAVLLGHHWNRVTTTRVYEHLGAQDYVYAYSVDA